MLKFEIEAPAQVTKFLVDKGSVAVDGISLTVVDIMKDGFTLVIIPHTAKLTTLGTKGPGETVNIETDILGKYVAKFLKREEDGDSRFMKTLMEGGYL
jgi:riboflavin synthase